MYRFLASAVCATCVLMTSSADGQIVRVGPFGGVSVRAPFVAVDAIPGGGARVRAPFTSVNTGVFAYRYGPVYRPYRYRYYYPPPVYYESVPVYPAVPVYPEVVYPEARVQPPSTRYQVARPPITMDAGEISKQLRASAQQLKRSLSLRRDDSDVWLNYLAPDRIIEAIDRGQSPDSLRQLLLNYDGVVGNASLVSIRGANGFAETHRWLQQFVETAAAASSAPAKTSPSDGDSVLAPTADDPAPANGAETKEPTPAKPIRPADEGGNQEAVQKTEPQSEELPVPVPL